MNRKLNYGFILGQIVLRFFRRLERKILVKFIRRKYLDPWNASMQAEPLLPFPLVLKDDAVSPDLKEDDTSFCILCNFEVRQISNPLGEKTLGFEFRIDGFVKNQGSRSWTK